MSVEQKKKKPGLRLTPKHLEASSTPSPTNHFREQIGNIMVNDDYDQSNYYCDEEQETSLAASYLAQSTAKPVRNQNIPVLREASKPPVVNSSFMEVKVEDLETLERLGEGAAGTVRKVLHKPTNIIMAKKVTIQDICL
jgi:hypothetical protein